MSNGEAPKSASARSLAPFIEHTLLAPDATQKDIERICHEAIAHQFKGVCVSSSWVALASELLSHSEVKVVSVIGFPLGNECTQSKAFEAENAVRHGAHEIDMVLALGRLKGQEYDYVRTDIKTVVDAARVPVKVILETHFLSDEQIKKACELATEAGAHFVKTSTGFTGGGATLPHVQIMRAASGTNVQIKASGGVRSADQAWKLIEAGATRLGTSRGIELISKTNQNQNEDSNASSGRAY